MANPTTPREPGCPPGRRRHSDRIHDIIRRTRRMDPDKTAGVVIDDTTDHRAYYLHALSQAADIEIVSHGVLSQSADGGTYIIKIKRRG